MKGWVALFAAILAIVGGGWLWLGHRPQALPRSIIDQISAFRPYFYTSSPPDDFVLDPSKVSYQNSLLTFRLTNPKHQTVTFAEQPLPAELHGSTTNGDQEVTGAYGSASVSFRDGRTIGVLLGKDQKTMVLINSGDDIGTDTMKDLLRYLKPQH